jgi:hypothetical protein
MKKLFSFLLTLVFVTSVLSCNTGNTTTPVNTTVSPGAAKKIEVYYFHFTRRCATCNAVETVTIDALKEYFPEKVKSGEITFKSLNLEEDNSKPTAEKLKVEGQQLLFVCNGKIIDITDAGFMYALNSPDKLKAEVKKTVDQLLK